MNANNGNLYDSQDDAIRKGELIADLVEIRGTRAQAERISHAVKDANRTKTKAQRQARRKNRRRP